MIDTSTVSLVEFEQLFPGGELRFLEEENNFVVAALVR